MKRSNSFFKRKKRKKSNNNKVGSFNPKLKMSGLENKALIMCSSIALVSVCTLTRLNFSHFLSETAQGHRARKQVNTIY